MYLEHSFEPSKYGRFWIFHHVLYYRTPQGKDIKVDQITLHKGLHRNLIARVNHQVIPTIAIAQLKTLLSQYGAENEPLFEQLSRYDRELENTVERLRHH